MLHMVWNLKSKIEFVWGENPMTPSSNFSRFFLPQQARNYEIKITEVKVTKLSAVRRPLVQFFLLYFDIL